MAKKRGNRCVWQPLKTSQASPFPISLLHEKCHDRPPRTLQTSSNGALEASSTATWGQSPLSLPLRVKAIQLAPSLTSDQKISGQFPAPCISKDARRQPVIPRARKSRPPQRQFYRTPFWRWADVTRGTACRHSPGPFDPLGPFIRLPPHLLLTPTTVQTINQDCGSVGERGLLLRGRRERIAIWAKVRSFYSHPVSICLVLRLNFSQV